MNENARRENELYVLALMTIDGIYATMLVYLRDTVLSNNGEIFSHENKQNEIEAINAMGQKHIS